MKSKNHDQIQKSCLPAQSIKFDDFTCQKKFPPHFSCNQTIFRENSWMTSIMCISNIDRYIDWAIIYRQIDRLGCEDRQIDWGIIDRQIDWDTIDRLGYNRQILA